eukprot:2284039-Amphidinium_carterae.1
MVGFALHVVKRANFPSEVCLSALVFAVTLGVWVDRLRVMGGALTLKVTFIVDNAQMLTMDLLLKPHERKGNFDWGFGMVSSAKRTCDALGTLAL